MSEKSDNPAIIDTEICRALDGKGERSTAEIAQEVGKLAQRPAIYRRLRSLANAGVLLRRKWGNVVLWKRNYALATA